MHGTWYHFISQQELAFTATHQGKVCFLKACIPKLVGSIVTYFP